MPRGNKNKKKSGPQTATVITAAATANSAANANLPPLLPTPTTPTATPPTTPAATPTNAVITAPAAPAQPTVPTVIDTAGFTYDQFEQLFPSFPSNSINVDTLTAEQLQMRSASVPGETVLLLLTRYAVSNQQIPLLKAIHARFPAEFAKHAFTLSSRDNTSLFSWLVATSFTADLFFSMWYLLRSKVNNTHLFAISSDPVFQGKFPFGCLVEQASTSETMQVVVEDILLNQQEIIPANELIRNQENNKSIVQMLNMTDWGKKMHTLINAKNMFLTRMLGPLSTPDRDLSVHLKSWVREATDAGYFDAPYIMASKLTHLGNHRLAADFHALVSDKSVHHEGSSKIAFNFHFDNANQLASQNTTQAARQVEICLMKAIAVAVKMPKSTKAWYLKKSADALLKQLCPNDIAPVMSDDFVFTLTNQPSAGAAIQLIHEYRKKALGIVDAPVAAAASTAQTGEAPPAAPAAIPAELPPAAPAVAAPVGPRIPELPVTATVSKPRKVVNSEASEILAVDNFESLLEDVLSPRPPQVTNIFDAAADVSLLQSYQCKPTGQSAPAGIAPKKR